MAVTADELAREVLLTENANLDADHQALVSTSLDEASEVVNRWAQWFVPGDGTSRPTEWEHWERLEGALRLARRARPERAGLLQTLRREAREEAIKTFASIAPSQTVAQNSDTLTLADVVRYVLGVCVRLDPMLTPDPWNVHNRVQGVLDDLWNQGMWTFRKKKVTMQIASSGAVTFSGLTGNQAFDGFAQQRLYYTTSGVEGWRLEYATADKFQRMKSSDVDGETGAPSYFRYSRPDGTLAFRFWPEPDQAYELDAEVLLAPPRLDDDNDNPENEITRLPKEFRFLLMQATAAEVVADHGHRAADRLLDRLKSQFDTVKSSYDDRGPVDDDQHVADVEGDYGLMSAQTPGWGNLGGAL